MLPICTTNYVFCINLNNGLWSKERLCVLTSPGTILSDNHDKIFFNKEENGMSNNIIHQNVTLLHY